MSEHQDHRAAGDGEASAAPEAVHGEAVHGEAAGGEGGHGVATQAGRFVLVGLTATAVHFLVIVISIHVFSVRSPTLATVFGTVLGTLTSYFGHHRYTFSAIGRHVPRFSMFIATYGLVMGLHAGTMYVLSDLLGIAYAIPFVIATVASATATFVLNRQIVFRPVS